MSASPALSSGRGRLLLPPALDLYTLDHSCFRVGEQLWLTDRLAGERLGSVEVGPAGAAEIFYQPAVDRSEWPWRVGGRPETTPYDGSPLPLGHAQVAQGDQFHPLPALAPQPDRVHIYG